MQAQLDHVRLAVAGGLLFASAAGLWLTTKVGGTLMMGGGEPAGLALHVILLFLMWWSMMMAMMLPSAAPAILTYRTVAAKLKPPPHTFVFAAGYAAVWSAFSAAAVILQIITHDIVPLTGMMAVVSTSVGGALLIAAGLYQFSPLKQACLRKCQAPLFYLARHWRMGVSGAFRMGISHGLHCLGCCWAIMLLLFYGGVMELTWIVGLALYVAAEKLLPARYQLDRVAGAALIAWGAAVMLLGLNHGMPMGSHDGMQM